MLKKLTKYELMAEWKKFAAVYAGMFILAVSLAVSYSLFKRLDDNDLVVMLMGTFRVGFAFISFAAFAMIVIFACMRFYKNLFRDEGYLMHTLPVSPWCHIFSKMISTYIWSAATFAVFVICKCISDGGTRWLESFFENVRYAGSTVILSGREEISVLVLAVTVFNILLTPALFQIIIGFCITVGSLSAKHKIFMSILTYIGVHTAGQIITGVTTAAGLIGRVNNPDSGAELLDGLTGSLVIGYVISAAMYAAMLYFTYYIMNKKLNLE